MSEPTNPYAGLPRDELLAELRNERLKMRAMDDALAKMRTAAGVLRRAFDGATVDGAPMSKDHVDGLIHGVALMFVGEAGTGIKPPSAADNSVVAWIDAGVPRDVVLEVLNDTRNMDRNALSRFLCDARRAQREYDEKCSMTPTPAGSVGTPPEGVLT